MRADVKSWCKERDGLKVSLFWHWMHSKWACYIDTMGKTMKYNVFLKKYYVFLMKYNIFLMWVCAKSEMADGLKVTLFRQWMHSKLRRISFRQKWDGWLVLPFCDPPPHFIISRPTNPILSFRPPTFLSSTECSSNVPALAKVIKKRQKGLSISKSTFLQFENNFTLSF